MPTILLGQGLGTLARVTYAGAGEPPLRDSRAPACGGGPARSRKNEEKPGLLDPLASSKSASSSISTKSTRSTPLAGELARAPVPESAREIRGAAGRRAWPARCNATGGRAISLSDT
jgi:hypothetical protein